MVMAPTVPPPAAPKTSKVETLKAQSQFLREPLASELKQDTTCLSEEGLQLLKFHGSYQQDDRDRRVKGQEKAYQFMLRTRTPGGFVPPQLYLTLDQLADEYGSGTLRATTRQAFQLHGILKKNLKTVMATIIKSMGSTLGACGDLNRNVMAPPAPFKNKPAYDLAWYYANTVADLLTPQTGAYYEIWLDGEKVVSGEEDPAVKAARQTQNNGTLIENSVEPIYGTHYMPRKFKMAVTVPGDNSIDLLTQDVGLVVITNKKGDLQGFNLYVGGGMGRTHNKEETFPRIADPLGYVDKADIYEVVKAIVATQRDYGDRHNRRHARMKYLIEDWGLERFRQVVEQYLGKAIQPLKPLPPLKYQDYLGWHEQGDGKLFVGLPVRNGRVLDRDGFQLKTALREIVERFALPMRVTANMPPWLLERMQAILGDECAAFVQAMEGSAPLDLRVNTFKAKREAVQAAFESLGFACTPTPYSPWGLRLQGKPALNRLEVFTRGDVEVQDEGSQLLALLTDAHRGEMVVDFCAGAGGKTLALGASMRNTGRLYAFDTSGHRLAALKPRLARSGLSNVHPVQIAHERDDRIKRLAGKIDRVLVDAPCSGLGTLRRNPDLKWRQKPESVAELAALQQAILSSAARLLKPGGRLVYATCSVLPEENEATVQAFLEAHSGFEALDAAAELTRLKVPEAAALCQGGQLRLWPQRHSTDGFFAAVLARRA